MKRKKILFLSQLYPYPPTSGGRIKTFNTLRTLAREYEVFAIFISEEKPSKTEIEYLTRLGIRVKIFYSTTILVSVKDDLWDLAWHFLRGIPHYVFQYTYGPAFPFIEKTIAAFQPDVIHVDHLNMAQYLPKVKSQTWILEHHNVETYLYWTRFVHTTKPSRKIYLLIEMVLTYVFEWKTLRRFDHIFAISSPEKKRLRDVFGVRNVSTQQLAYPLSHVLHRRTNRPNMLFIGGLGWPPNEDAIEWFLSSIFPRIKQQIPDAQFHIVGMPGRRYIPSRQNDVFVHGFQKDLSPFLARADVFVLPFRMGGGMRIKSLTALANGIPLVSTSLGVEGLSVHNGKDCLIAEDPKQFAECVISLVCSKSAQQAFRRNGLRYMREYHGEEKNTEFLRQYERAIQGFS